MQLRTYQEWDPFLVKKGWRLAALKLGSFDSSQSHGIVIPNHSNTNAGGNPAWSEAHHGTWFKPALAEFTGNGRLGYYQRQVIYERWSNAGNQRLSCWGQSGDNTKAGRVMVQILNRAEATPWGGVLPYNETVGYGVTEGHHTTVQANGTFIMLYLFTGIQ